MTSVADPDLGYEIQIWNPVSGSGFRYQDLESGIRIWNPGSGALLTPGSGIGDGKFQIWNPGSGINIPDPQMRQISLHF
jgi:hypothetical protein